MSLEDAQKETKIIMMKRSDFIKEAEQLIQKHFPGIVIEQRRQYKQISTLIPQKSDISRCCPIAMRQHTKNNVYFCIDFMIKRVGVKCFKPECTGSFYLEEESNFENMTKAITKPSKKRKTGVRYLPTIADSLVNVQIITRDLPGDECLELYDNFLFVYVKAKKEDKRPVFSGWTKTSLEQVEHFDFDKYNLAVLTGEKSGIFVLDIDVKDNGLKWFHNFSIENNFNYTNYTLCVKTPSGGLHLYFKYDSNISFNSVRMKDSSENPIGLDIRSTDGCVIAPPSKYSTGSYKFVNLISPQKCPEFLLSLFVS